MWRHLRKAPSIACQLLVHYPPLISTNFKLQPSQTLQTNHGIHIPQSSCIHMVQKLLVQGIAGSSLLLMSSVQLINTFMISWIELVKWTDPSSLLLMSSVQLINTLMISWIELAKWGQPEKNRRFEHTNLSSFSIQIFLAHPR